MKLKLEFSVALKTLATLETKRDCILNLCYKSNKYSERLYGKLLLKNRFLVILTQIALCIRFLSIKLKLQYHFHKCVVRMN